MKIFLIPPPALPIPAVRGGAVETLISHLIEENERQAKAELVCVSLPDPEAQKRAEGYRHTKIHFLPATGPMAQHLWGPVCGQLRRMGRPAPLDPWYEHVRKLIALEKPDCVVAEGGDLTEPAAIAHQVGREKMWAHLHMQLRATQQLEDMYGGILAISRFVADQWQPTGHCKVRLVPNCVDVARFSPEPETPEEQSRLRQMLGYTDEDFVVLYCGRVCEEKGVHRLIEAMVRLDDPHMKLLVVGSPFFAAEDESPFFERLRREAEPLRQAGRIQFTGYLPNESLPPYYRLADAACFPAIWDEPAGIVVIEAMACGCPIVATASGGMSEYLNGSGALLVSRDETWKAGVCKPVPGMEPLADQLAEAFRQLKNDPERREKMAQSGPERARMFSRQAYYENFLAALQPQPPKAE